MSVGRREKRILRLEEPGDFYTVSDIGHEAADFLMAAAGIVDGRCGF
jgi:hypothetical protein